jgi:hypothetical protein
MGSGSRQRRTAEQEQGEGGGFSYQQSRCQDAVAADATVPVNLLSGAPGTVTGKAHSALVFAELLGLLN